MIFSHPWCFCLSPSPSTRHPEGARRASLFLTLWPVPPGPTPRQGPPSPSLHCSSLCRREALPSMGEAESPGCWPWDPELWHSLCTLPPPHPLPLTDQGRVSGQGQPLPPSLRALGPEQRCVISIFRDGCPSPTDAVTVLSVATPRETPELWPRVVLTGAIISVIKHDPAGLAVVQDALAGARVIGGRPGLQGGVVLNVLRVQLDGRLVVSLGDGVNLVPVVRTWTGGEGGLLTGDMMQTLRGAWVAAWDPPAAQGAPPAPGD